MPGFREVFCGAPDVPGVDEDDFFPEGADSIDHIFARRVQGAYAIADPVCGTGSEVHHTVEGLIGIDNARLP